MEKRSLRAPRNAGLSRKVSARMAPKVNGALHQCRQGGDTGGVKLIEAQADGHRQHDWRSTTRVSFEWSGRGAS
jgi:hypothetical protein